jgi:hypothetical protein
VPSIRIVISRPARRRQQWLLSPGTSFMVSRMRRIVNGTLEGTEEPRR